MKTKTEPMVHVLPVSAYTDPAWFQREQESIFSRTWRYAGLAEDLSEPGQYISVQAGLNNLFIVMGRDRRLRAFHNICRPTLRTCSTSCAVPAT